MGLKRKKKVEKVETKKYSEKKKEGETDKVILDRGYLDFVKVQHNVSSI